MNRLRMRGKRETLTEMIDRMKVEKNITREILEEERIGRGFVVFERRPQGRGVRLYKITCHLPIVEKDGPFGDAWEMVSYQTNSMMKAQKNYVESCHVLAVRSAALMLMEKGNG